MIHTPTPDAGTVYPYAAAGLALCGLACLPLAAHLHARWFTARGVPLSPVYATVMAIIVASGTVLLGPEALLGCTPGAWVPAVPLGLLLGVIVIRADTGIVRALTARPISARRAANRGRAPGTAAARSFGGLSTRPAGVALGARTGRRRVVGLARTTAFQPSHDDYRVASGWLIAVAVLEELVYRGVLLHLAGELATPLAAAGMVAVTVAFMLAHVFFGWVQVAAKAPLALLTLLATLATGGAGAAVVCHVVFNGYVAWYRRALPERATT